MINPQELRIGNWLNGANGQYFQVDGHGIMTLQYEETPREDVSPIPLTPEILEKAEFEKIAGVWECSVMHLENYSGVYGFWYMTSLRDVELKYVHQLQNLYWCLVGKELEIKL